MGKNKNKKKKEKIKEKPKISLPEKTKRWIWGTFCLLFALIFVLSFLNKAGITGKILFSLFFHFIGKATYFLPAIFLLSGLVFFFSHYEKFLNGILLAIFLFLFSLSGFFGALRREEKMGGYLGLFASFLIKLFGPLVSEIIFLAIFAISLLIFWHLLKRPEVKEKGEIKPSLIKRIFFAPKFKVKEIEKTPVFNEKKVETKKEIPKTPVPVRIVSEGYRFPALDLLDSETGQPSPGDVQQNSLIIKKTLEHFGIPVQMGQVNVGPTVTQYTLKPAEGIKLSKITALSNDLALALASHPIRIEAPIPGKSLVGVEVPNKVRLLVRLKDLIAHPSFQNAPSLLTFCLGRDVAGTPVYADLARMPHLMVAGSTGSGKTIFLNDLILSLLYRNSPEILRFILIDPKRVEFPVYNELPHLLAPVVVDVKKAVITLQWLIGEMERRFDLLSETKSRDLVSYNEMVQKKKEFETLPYIVLIVDELADLMAARGKEIEAGIVRIAQMARAVGIHLVVATQRPSVEVITGLIKANITARVSFQVASQVDSRTILDVAGAEKLLGRGDLLFLSAETVKPKRIQGAFVSEKEVKRVVNFIKTQNAKLKIGPEIEENGLSQELKMALDGRETEMVFSFEGKEDPLYEEAKRVVIEAKKASASLLQRRLSIGYARAARLLDMLEKRGIVGPADGAKPRKVYLTEERETEKEENENEEGWEKV